MVVRLNLPDDRWEFLKPILEGYRMTEWEYDLAKTRVNKWEILDLNAGVRIWNILKQMDIEWVSQLLELKKEDFCKQPNAGKISWMTINAYVEQLKTRLKNGERI